jgi:hypothetical protein
VPDIDTIRTKAVEPRTLAVGRLPSLDLEVVFAQRQRTRAGLQRLRERFEPLGEKVLN